jgi:hypothetical protein
MSKFTYICEHVTGEKNTYTCDREFLPEVLADIEQFLKGCGYVFDGVVDIVNEDA